MIHYCDHAATTPCRREVWERMQLYALYEFGNPSSFHSLGLRARQAVEQAREQIAHALGAASDEIVFTSGGSESINLAIRGAVLENGGEGSSIVSCGAEHEASLSTCQALAEAGCKVLYFTPDSSGRYDPATVRDMVDEHTTLVTIMHANNELGTVQPVAEIVREVRSKRPDILIHVDGVQAVGHIPVNVADLDVDLLSFAAHKFYGPKGAGGLFVRRGTRLEPGILGGQQECGVRSGTESVPLIVGMATALQLSLAEMPKERRYWRRFRDRVARRVLSRVGGARLTVGEAETLDHFLHMSFLGIEGEDLVLMLDSQGICASSGSACSLAKGPSSHVLEATGQPAAWSAGSLRLTFGHGCRELDADWLANRIVSAVRELRALRPMTPSLSRQVENRKIS